jgi:hypothetical protein
MITTKNPGLGTMRPQESIPVVIVKAEARVDSRILAGHLGVKPKNTFELILRYETEFREIDQLLFKTADGKRIQGGGNAERYALVTEDQSFFLLSLSRNSKRVVRLKMRLIQSFRQARDALELGKGYLPFYHDLHDAVKHLADAAKTAGSGTPAHVFHSNVNRMVNAAMGLGSGERHTLAPHQRIAIMASNHIAQKAIERTLSGGGDHRSAYADAKKQVQNYAIGAHLLLGTVNHGA